MSEKGVSVNRRMSKTTCLLFAALLGAGWCVGELRARRVDAKMRDCLVDHAVHVAKTLDPRIVGELSFTAADQGTPAYEFIRSQLIALGTYCSHRGIYTMALREGRLVFGPENYAPDDPMASPPGTAYEKPGPDDFQVFATGKPAAFGPATDEYGTFVCALAPVCDPNSGKVLMVVGIDSLANDWNAAVGATRRRSVLGSLIAAAVLGGAVRLWSWRGRCRKANEAARQGQSSGGFHGLPAPFLPGRNQQAGLLIGMGLLAVAFLAVVLVETWCWTGEHIDTMADQQSRLAVQVEKALRDYVGKSIRPEMEKRVAEGEFIPEAMSTSFVARSVFDEVRKVFPEAIVRFPSTNPRNPANRATPAEESLIRYFQEHPEADSWSGVIKFFEQGQKHFVWALPRRFNEGCLQCHGRPEDAPASLVQQYGPIAGFGRSVGEVSMDLAAVPVGAAYARAGARVWRHMLIALVLCMVFLAGIAFLIRGDCKRRRSAEMAIEKERSFLRLVIDSIPGFVCVKSQEGRLVIANETLAKACGATVGEIEGKCEADVAPRLDQMEDRRRDDLEVLTTRRAKVIPEEPITYPDGTTRWFTTTKVPLIDEDGVCRQLLAVATDITDRKRAEEERKESYSLLEATLESTADGILAVDRRGKIRGLNTQFQTLWRIPDEILESRDDKALLSFVLGQLKDPDSFLAKVRDLYAHPDAESFDLIEFADGRVIERYSKPQMLGDQIVGRVWSFRDVTEKHTAEQKRTALLQKIAAINEELTHFAYVVSHDLKAPLRGIKLVSEWLCADYGDKLGPDAKEQLDLLQSRVGRMHDLIDGVLQYSRVGRVHEDLVPVDLNELIPSIVDSLAPPEHVTVVVEPGLPTIECEKTRIGQVFQNLLSNAIKFLDKPQGEVRVSCVEDGEFWRFSVSDNGPGIESRHFDRIFRLFQTLAPRDEFESTGVGLAVVKKVVETYGGRVWVESEPGRGSTFLFSWPRNREAVASEHSTLAAACQPVS